MLVTVAQFAIMMTCTTHKHVFFIYCSARGNQSQTEIEDGMRNFLPLTVWTRLRILENPASLLLSLRHVDLNLSYGKRRCFDSRCELLVILMILDRY